MVGNRTEKMKTKYFPYNLEWEEADERYNVHRNANTNTARSTVVVVFFFSSRIDHQNDEREKCLGK